MIGILNLLEAKSQLPCGCCCPCWCGGGAGEYAAGYASGAADSTGQCAHDVQAI